MPLTPVKMIGNVRWTQSEGFNKQGKAECSLSEDGRLMMDVDDGVYVYGVVIEANDMGSWTSGGAEGKCNGSLSRTKKGYDLHGKWYEDGEEFSWRIEFKIVKKLPHRV
jgi:hypothetical protein